MTRDRFASLADLMARHAELVPAVGRDLLAPDNLARVETFVRRAVATGAVLEARADRAAAQEVIGFWTARVATAARERARDARKAGPGGPDEPPAVPDFGDTLLADYDPATLHEAIAAAERVLRELSPAGRDLARGVVLRMVRLRAKEPVFDPVPAPLPALRDLGDPAEVDRLIGRLEDAGVLRVDPPDQTGVAWVGLRSAGLLDAWPSLQGWMAGRKEKRARADHWQAQSLEPGRAGGLYHRLRRILSWVGLLTNRVWAAADRLVPVLRLGRAEGNLLTGGDLEEALRYHDRTDTERRFLDASRAREQLTNERNRVLMGVFGLLALFAVVGWVTAGFGWRRAEDKAAMARKETKLKDTALTEVSEKEADRAARERLTALRLLVRAQARVVTARTPEGRALALFAWDEQLPQMPGEFFLTPKALGELRNQAEEIQSDSGLCRSPDLTVAEIQGLRDRVAERPDTRLTLEGIRKVSFALVRVATAGIDDEFRKAKASYTDVLPYVDEFWTQYWGEMLLVEGESVTTAMVRFGRVLNDIRDYAERPEGVPKEMPKKEEGPGPKKDGPSKSKDGPSALGPRPAPAVPPSAKVNELVEQAKKLSLGELDRLARKIREREVPAALRTRLAAATKELHQALDTELAGPLPGPPAKD